MDALDDQLQDLFPPDRQPNEPIYSHLFDDNNSNRSLFFNQPHSQNRQLEQVLPPDGQQEENQAFNLRTIEKEDQIRPIPEKIEVEQGEEEALDFGPFPKRPVLDSYGLEKRCSALSKTAYLQETRQDKIARYLFKKERRVWSHKISYECRRVVARKRQRLNGRFIKKEDNNNQGSSTKKSSRQYLEEEVQQPLTFKVEDCCE